MTDTIEKIKADYLSEEIGKITFHRRASALGFTTDAIRQILFETGLPLTAEDRAPTPAAEAGT